MFNVSDAGIAILILFIYNLLKMVSSVANSNVIESWTNSFPKTLLSVRSPVFHDSIRYDIYVACPKCHSLYNFEDCIGKSGSRMNVVLCKHKEYPNHPVSHYRSACNTPLLRICKHNKFYPYKSYPYQSLKSAITRLLKRVGFLEKCEMWRQRKSVDGYVGDVYDGNVWKEFYPFLSNKYSWLVTMNIDWFQPFSHVADSVGAIYLVIQNLPRQDRFRSENMILVGIIPGPKEPSLNINSYLTPLVLELRTFFQGVTMRSITKDGKSFRPVNVHVALMCVTCDLPATRKVCGFLSYNAVHGCSKCLRSFLACDFSGYDTKKWTPRDIDEHRRISNDYKGCISQSSRIDIEKEYGIRYSVLIELPYFNPIRHSVIDPMHNLFLGSVKRCMQHWIDENILTKKCIMMIEKRVEMLIAPRSVGRLPIKISSGFAGFSADQWRNWTIFYSAVALKGILPENHLRYWLLFVKACTLLNSRMLKKSDIELAHKYLTMFCTQFEAVNGKQFCTPNMHLHLHLKDCLLDYGPLYAFWCYPFERYNGYLGRFPTNLKNIEPQLMKKCLSAQELYCQAFPDEGLIFRNLLNQHKSCGGLSVSMSGDDVNRMLSLTSDAVKKNQSFEPTSNERCLPPIRLVTLNKDMAKMLHNVYHLLYEPVPPFEHMSWFVRQASRVVIGEDLYNSACTSRENSTVVSAYWPSSESEHQTSAQSMPLSIGHIQHFIKHDFSALQVTDQAHIFAVVLWFKRHVHYNWFGSSAIVCSSETEPMSTFSIIPIQRIVSVCVYGRLELSFTPNTKDTIIVAIPTNSHHCY